MEYELISVRKQSINPDILEVKYVEITTSFWISGEERSLIKTELFHYKYGFWKLLKNDKVILSFDSSLDTINKSLQVNQTILL